MLWLPLSILDIFESKEVVVYGIYIIFNICFGIFPNYKHSLIVYYIHNVTNLFSIGLLSDVKNKTIDKT